MESLELHPGRSQGQNYLHNNREVSLAFFILTLCSHAAQFSKGHMIVLMLHIAFRGRCKDSLSFIAHVSHRRTLQKYKANLYFFNVLFVSLGKEM